MKIAGKASSAEAVERIEFGPLVVYPVKEVPLEVQRAMIPLLLGKEDRQALNRPSRAASAKERR